METLTVTTPPRYDGLQWGRAIAAMTVVIVHAAIYPVGSAGLTHLLSRFGVTLFFVISGYLMVVTTGPATFNGLIFLRKRLVRIVPLYYLATAVAVAGVLILPTAFKDTVFDVRHILMSMLFLPMYEPGTSGAIDPFLRLGWTLNYEMFFYVCFALLCWLGRMQRAVVLSLVFVVLLLLGQTHDYSNAMLQFYTRVDIIAFLGGVWLGVLFQNQRGRLSLFWAAVLLIVALSGLWAIHHYYGAIRDNVWTQIAIEAICTMIIAVLALVPRLPGGGFGRFMMAAGDASYSMYLFHMFVVGAVTFFVSRFAPELGWTRPYVAAVGGILIGFVVYRLAERPIQNFVHRNRTRPDKFRVREA